MAPPPRNRSIIKYCVLKFGFCLGLAILYTYETFFFPSQQQNFSFFDNSQLQLAGQFGTATEASASCIIDHTNPCVNLVSRLSQTFGVDEEVACLLAVKQGRCVATVPWKWDGTGRDQVRDKYVGWWKDHPGAPVGISCALHDDMRQIDLLSNDFDRRPTHGRHKQFRHQSDASPPIFQGRMPIITNRRTQVAIVISFVEFQIHLIVKLLAEFWWNHSPCGPNTPQQSADLIFFTENKLSETIKSRIRFAWHELEIDKTSCFRSQEPIFLHLDSIDPKLSHLEGAANAFFSLFSLLEQNYATFMLTEPDIAPIRPNFVPAIVKKSLEVSCDADGVWQVGSAPLATDVHAGNLMKRLDYHMNGNAIYALGCPQFEDYKCRVQTFYVPKGDCARVAGCSTHREFEGGYDHAMYRFRVNPENYEYSRQILSKFVYSDLVQNLGESIYNASSLRELSPSTYFAHSKSIFVSKAATILKEISVSFLKKIPCQIDKNMNNGILKARKDVLELIHRRLRSGEYEKEDAIGHLCDVSLRRIFADIDISLCSRTDQLSVQSWTDRMPGKTYLWTMDIHGGPSNCDISIITEAGGALHSEIIGMCEHYGLCIDRLKVMKYDDMREYDPSDDLKEKFRLAYQDDDEFKRVDAFICHHPVANCELFLPFNKPIIIHASTRLEFGRHDEGINWRLDTGYNREEGKKKWKQWIETVQMLAKDKRNVIAANNLYDRDYIKYFTGIEDVELLPSWCGEGVGVEFCRGDWHMNVPNLWLPTRSEVMIVPYRANLDRTRYEMNICQPVHHPIIQELHQIMQDYGGGTAVKLISEVYDNANPLNMLKHPAIIILPYQVSTIQLIELYRLNIPTFCPSLSLLKKWCQDHDLMWEVQYGWPENLMKVENIPNPNGQKFPDKYSVEWEKMFDHWIPKSDFYQFKHITYFDSWEHFFSLYHEMTTNKDLEKIHLRMAKVNRDLRVELVKRWRQVLNRVKK